MQRANHQAEQCGDCRQAVAQCRMQRTTQRSTMRGAEASDIVENNHDPSHDLKKLHILDVIASLPPVHLRASLAFETKEEISRPACSRIAHAAAEAAKAVPNRDSVKVSHADAVACDARRMLRTRPGWPPSMTREPRQRARDHG